ncbi:MAG: sigma 54-interacting transcriptional regulator [Pseudomonadota bacterium]
MNTDAPTLTGKSRPVVLPRLPVQDAQAGAVPGGLRIERAGHAPVDMVLDPEQRYLLGRHDAADIGFAAAEVSRLHGVLRVVDGVWHYEDMGSHNGSVLRRAGHASQVALQAREAMAVGVGDTVALGCDEARLLFVERPPLPGVRHDATARSEIARLFENNLQVAARTRVPVFLLGPSGCGKTRAARRIHDLGRSSGSFVPVNCARLPADPSALHSELLGHVKGAYTGAEADRTGRLVHADGGTLFLDEVESLSPLAQGFLLDVLEGSGDLAPLGSRRPLQQAPIFRLLSASKRPLGESTLRDDLCERLAEGHLWRVPTLDQRREDIPGLIRAFAREQSTLLGVEVELAEDTVTLAVGADWPGQIRQLRAAIYVLAQWLVARTMVDHAPPRRVRIERVHLVQHLRERDEAFGLRRDITSDSAADSREQAPAQKADARRLSAAQLRAILQECAGNRSEAARRLGIARNTLARKIREFGLEP